MKRPISITIFVIILIYSLFSGLYYLVNPREGFQAFITGGLNISPSTYLVAMVVSLILIVSNIIYIWRREVFGFWLSIVNGVGIVVSSGLVAFISEKKSTLFYEFYGLYRESILRPVTSEQLAELPPEVMSFASAFSAVPIFVLLYFLIKNRSYFIKDNAHGSKATLKESSVTEGVQERYKKYKFRSLEGLSKWVVGGLVFYCVVTIFYILNSLLDLIKIKSLLESSSQDWEHLLEVSLPADLIVFGPLLAMLVTGICFFFWFIRAYKNAYALKYPGLKYAPAWTIWGFFIPVFDFFRPYQMMGQLWDKVNSNKYGRVVLDLWWGLWITSEQMKTSGLADPVSLLGLHNSTLRDIYVLTLFIGAGICLILLVRGVTQEQKLSQLKHSRKT